MFLVRGNSLWLNRKRNLLNGYWVSHRIIKRFGEAMWKLCRQHSPAPFFKSVFFEDSLQLWLCTETCRSHNWKHYRWTLDIPVTCCPGHSVMLHKLLPPKRILCVPCFFDVLVLISKSGASVLSTSLGHSSYPCSREIREINTCIFKQRNGRQFFFLSSKLIQWRDSDAEIK